MTLVALGFSTSAQDVGVISVISPPENVDLNLDSMYEVTVRIQNFGTSSIQNIPVKYALGFNDVLLENYLISIPAGGTADFTFTDSLDFTSTLAMAGYAQTELLGDTDPNNDRVDTQYTVASIFDNLEDVAGVINIYPNPVVDQLSIDYKGSDPVNVNIYNVAGQHVRSLGSISGKDVNDFDVSDLESGVYMVQVSSEKGTTYKKFVK